MLWQIAMQWAEVKESEKITDLITDDLGQVCSSRPGMAEQKADLHLKS
jgi:hypothetical protein